MLELQRDLIKHGLYAVINKYNLLINRHPLHPELVSFKYQQHLADFSIPSVRQARGIVLNQDDNWSIVCKAYDKFFNIGETLGYSAEQVADWKAYEKLDGSLLMLYSYKGNWYFASTGKAWHEELHAKAMPLLLAKQQSVHSLHEGLTYAFELIGPCNLHVVQYATDELILHGLFQNGRMLVNGTSLLHNKNWQEKLNTISGLAAEGYVLVGPNGEMAKAKSADYVTLHRVANGFNAKAVSKIVAEGEWDEVYALWPAKLEPFKYMLAKRDEYWLMFEKNFIWYESQKECALAVKHLPIADAVFKVRAGKFKNFEEWLIANHETLIEKKA